MKNILTLIGVIFSSSPNCMLCTLLRLCRTTLPITSQLLLTPLSHDFYQYDRGECVTISPLARNSQDNLRYSFCPPCASGSVSRSDCRRKLLPPEEPESWTSISLR